MKDIPSLEEINRSLDIQDAVDELPENKIFEKALDKLRKKLKSKSPLAR